MCINLFGLGICYENNLGRTKITKFVFFHVYLVNYEQVDLIYCKDLEKRKILFLAKKKKKKVLYD